MSDRWIVSFWKFKEHESLESAKTEAARLHTKHPEKYFRIYHIKSKDRK